MPTYAYACTACDHRFEVRQSFTDPAVGECPECAGGVRKLFNSVGIVFKGSGFYKTDSRTGDGKGSNGPAKESAAKESTSTDSSAKDTSSTTTSSGTAGTSGTSGTKDSTSAA